MTQQVDPGSYDLVEKLCACNVEILKQALEDAGVFEHLRVRVAELRKERDITQVQLAEHLGISQQTINAYETGYRRFPVSELPPLARYLGLTLDELVGETAQARKRGPTPKLQRQMELIQQLLYLRLSAMSPAIHSLLSKCYAKSLLRLISAQTCCFLMRRKEGQAMTSACSSKPSLSSPKKKNKSPRHYLIA